MWGGEFKGNSHPFFIASLLEGVVFSCIVTPDELDRNVELGLEFLEESNHDWDLSILRFGEETEITISEIINQ